MDIVTLLSLAKIGCCEKMMEFSSSDLAKRMQTSQQTASRKIRKLEKEGYIAREMIARGQRIKLTSKGINALKQIYTDLEKIFDKAEKLSYRLTGEVCSGIGEGGYYMKIAGYREQFEEKLGFLPYPGTLNLKLKTSEDREVRQILQKLRGIEIVGFAMDDRTFGAVKCFKAEIDGIRGAIVIPDRTHHGFDAVEIIAKEKIRDALKLKDGDIVTVRVEV
jgi:riboflavin kinase